MARSSLGLLAEHLCCTPGDLHAAAAFAADAASILFDLELSGASYCAIPLRADDGELVVVLADQPFAVPHAVDAMRPLTQAQGTRSGRMSSAAGAAALLSLAHSDAAGPARLSDDWLRIARGEADGNTRGIYQSR